jgi:hypothetical protein
MALEHDADDRPQQDEPQAEDAEPQAEDDRGVEAVWTPPERSDQRPGEEAVQVNDRYRGGGPPPRDESHGDDDQHPTGG